MDIIDRIAAKQMKDDVPDFNVGDTIRVHNRVVEGGKERIQIFEGIVIAKRGTGVSAAFTVRKISSGEGVERVYQIHSPRIAKIEVRQKGKVRRAKLHYLRDRVGKRATQVRKATEKVPGEAAAATAVAAADEIEEVLDSGEEE